MMAFLSIALIPLGLIAFVQTNQLAEETRLRWQLDITALTESAVSAERSVLERAGGAAAALAAAAGIAEEGPAACSAFMKRFVASNTLYSHAGVLTPDGRMACASRPNDADFSGYDGFDDLIENPRANITANEAAPISGRSVIIVSEPVFFGGAFQGYVSLSVPSESLTFDSPALRQTELEEVILFNETGEFLASKGDAAQVAAVLPEDFDPGAFADGRTYSFARNGSDGTERVFNITPLMDDLVFAISVWPTTSQVAGAVTLNGFALVLPMVMWAASVMVAFLAVNRLVIRPTKILGQRMRRFAITRNISPQRFAGDLSQEVKDMESNFLDMANAILRDEAEQENRLHEKSVLLKEVHHRVKNNLQLISSIMNMQIRRSDSTETQRELMSLQDRVRSLATIYRKLYQNDDLGHVDAAELVRDVISDIAVPKHGQGIKGVTSELKSLELYPDQAVPLSLFVAEALSTAAEICPDGGCSAHVRFGPNADGLAEVMVSADCHADATLDADADGLSQRLLHAFAVQMGGELEVEIDDAQFRTAVRFAVSDFKPERVDY